MKKERLTKILTYCGSIPLVFLTYLIFSKTTHFLAFNVTLMLISYSAIILSFTSGMHFSYAILQDKICSKLLILSNIVALVSWLCLLINFKLALVVIIIGYIFNLIIDFVSYKNLVFEKWFLNLRLRISLIVVFCLVLNFWRIF
jgi:hypothetical protein